jgi:hypothetical protein
MNVNTLVGALVASLILFGSSLVTLFTNNPDLTFEQISTATWVSLVGGRLVNKVTGSGDGGGVVG